MANIASGTTVAHLSLRVINDYLFVLPDKETIEKFGKISRTIFYCRQNLVNENQKLAAMRDLLLPKLMSGKLKI
jgi:type I restriction enzyme S subunit